MSQRFSCQHQRGMISYPGQVELGSDRLFFKPERLLDRLIGAGELSIPISEITDLSYNEDATPATLSVHVTDASYIFTGPESGKIRLELNALLQAQSGAPIQASRSTVLVEGEAFLVRESLVPIRLQLTTETFTWGGDEPRSKEYTVSLHEIGGFSLYDGRLRLTIGEETLLLDSPLIPALLANLKILKPMGEAPPDQDGILQHWKVSQVRGLVHHPGRLGIYRNGVEYDPLGGLDNLIGVVREFYPFDSLSELKFIGWPERKLGLKVGLIERTFTMEEVDRRVREIIKATMVHYQGEHPLERVLEEQHYEGILNLWQGEIPRYEDERWLLGTPCIYTYPSQQGWAGGWLLLSYRRLLFLPMNGPSGGQAPFLCPRLDLRRSVVHREHSREICLIQGEEQHNFLIPSGSETVRKFWKLCPLPTRYMEPGSWGQRLLRKWLSRSQHVMVYLEGEPLMRLHPEEVKLPAAGVKLELDADLLLRFSEGHRVSFEFAMENGQHSFDTEVIAKKVLESEEESKPDKIHLTCAPDYGRQLRIYNKRKGFRLITHQEAQVRSSESEWAQQNPVDCLLTNLSIGGASFSSEARFSMSQEIYLLVVLPWMPEGSDALEFLGRVVWVRELPRGEGPTQWSHGLRFNGLDEPDIQIIQRLIMQLQREEKRGEEPSLSQRGRGSDSGEGSGSLSGGRSRSRFSSVQKIGSHHGQSTSTYRSRASNPENTVNTGSISQRRRRPGKRWFKRNKD